MSEDSYIRWFEEITADDVAIVGGKNASLGEMYRELSSKGIGVPNGFATTAQAYYDTLKLENALERIEEILVGLDTNDVENLQTRAKKIRNIIAHLSLSTALEAQIRAAYQQLCNICGEDIDVAVRSSATAEDLPQASFAGQQESYLNIRGEEELLAACQRCFASLFTDRAISYREDQGFEHLSVGLSVGIQKMVRSDKSSAGVIFTIDTESGFQDVVLITGAYGLGENVVQGRVNPDEFMVFKPCLKQGFRPIVSKTLGEKQIMMVYDQGGKNTTKNIRVPRAQREQFILTDEEILKLASWACIIEEHYTDRAGKLTPMDIEWAKDGISGELFIVQARPETVVSRSESNMFKHYSLKERGEVLAAGRAVGQKIGAGKAHIIKSVRDIEKFKPGEVLVTETTDPDWEPIMKLAAGLVTDRGGRTSHAAIVSRELGIPCIVGTGEGTKNIPSDTFVTVSCAEGDAGKVYKGQLEYSEQVVDVSDLPSTRTKVALNIGDPDSAFRLAALPNDGIGLARLEFIISATIGIHPRALVDFEQVEDPSVRREIEQRTLGYENKGDFFVEKLAQGVGKLAAAFYPKPVIVRMSDFKSNEYANLIGGTTFEPQEENPMIGWRGASRYYRSSYQAGFALECAAMLKVRDEFGLNNLKLMIPFCRTVEEAKRVVEVLEENGLKSGENGLEVYGMCEIPSNVLLADEFLDIFDGFSIGTNDLTQLTLGLDRDSELVADLFDERNEAVKRLVREVIEVANRKKKYIGICGDAPSSFPEFASFLIEAGIGTISLSPDAVLSTREAIAAKERELGISA